MSLENKNILTAIAKVNELLEELVTDEVLADVKHSHIGLDAQGLDGLQAYPVAVTHPAVMFNNRAEDFRSNLRTHNVIITVVFNRQGGALTSLDMTSTIMDIVNKFDNHITLDGSASYVEPTTSGTYQIEGATDRVAIDIVLSINTTHVLNFLGQ